MPSPHLKYSGSKRSRGGLAKCGCRGGGADLEDIMMTKKMMTVETMVVLGLTTGQVMKSGDETAVMRSVAAAQTLDDATC